MITKLACKRGKAIDSSYEKERHSLMVFIPAGVDLYSFFTIALPHYGTINI